MGITARSILANSVWNYFGAGFSIVITLVTTPLYLKVLGLERYGVLAVLTALLAPIGVLNAGVTQATVKYVATFINDRNEGAARDVVSASLVINIVVGLLGAIVCVLGAPYFLAFGFKISPALVPDAVASFRLLGVVWLVTQIGGNFRGVLEGARDQRIVVFGDCVGILVNAILCTTGAFFTSRLSWFIGGQLGASVMLLLFWYGMARRALDGWQFRWSAARAHLRRVYGYSIWQVVNATIAVLANMGDRYFIGICLSATTLGAYNVPLRIQTVARTLFYSVNQALFPAASAAAPTRGASERLTVSTTWNVSLLAGVGLACIAVCGPAFLEIWVGPEISGPMGLALRILVITLFFEIPSATGSSYLNAHALTRLTALNNAATTALTIALMIPLGLSAGVNGVAVAALAGLVLTRVPFHVWLYAKHFQAHVAAGEFWKAFYGVGLVAITMILPASVGFDFLWSKWHNFAGFVAGCAATLCAVSIGMLFSVVVLLRDGKILRGVFKRIAARASVALTGRVSPS